MNKPYIDLGSKEATGLAKWILYSGIQKERGDSGIQPDHQSGGFYSWYNMQKQTYPFVYSEITGYGITTLLFLKQFSADSKSDITEFNELSSFLCEKAKNAADWIITHALDMSGGVYTRQYTDSSESEQFYSFTRGNILAFDTGMVLFGMASLYEQTKDQRYRSACVKMADFLISLQKRDGSLYAYYNPETKEKFDIEDKWSNQSGSYHAKTGMGLWATFAITGDECYKESAIRLCDYALTNQKPEGRFVTSRKDHSTHQHPHSYAAEGLFYVGLRLGKTEYIKAAIRAVNWSFETQKADWGIPQIFLGDSVLGDDPANPKNFLEHERTDIMSQVLRLGYIVNTCLDEKICGTENALRIPDEKLHNLKEKLVSYLLSSGPQAGGLLYGYDENGIKHSDVNSWCSFFAIQALILANASRDAIACTEYLI